MESLCWLDNKRAMTDASVSADSAIANFGDGEFNVSSQLLVPHFFTCGTKNYLTAREVF